MWASLLLLVGAAQLCVGLPCQQQLCQDVDIMESTRVNCKVEATVTYPSSTEEGALPTVECSNKCAFKTESKAQTFFVGYVYRHFERLEEEYGLMVQIRYNRGTNGENSCILVPATADEEILSTHVEGQSACILPTSPSTTMPTTVHDSTIPPSSPLPTTVRDSTVPPTAPSSPLPTLVPTTVHDSTIPPTTAPSSPFPTTVRDSTVPPTSAPSSPLPTTVRDSTIPSTTASSSLLPTTVRDSTVPPTTAPSSQLPTTIPSTTVHVTHDLFTKERTTLPSSTVPVTHDFFTTERTTLPSTTVSTTLPTTVPDTHDFFTTGKTTLPQTTMTTTPSTTTVVQETTTTSTTTTTSPTTTITSTLPTETTPTTTTTTPRPTTTSWVCGSDWILIGRACFHISDVSGDWSEGLDYCAGLGATLASVRSQEEQDGLAGLIDDNAWIGLHDMHSEGEHLWEDQTDLAYTNWQPGQPDNSGTFLWWGSGEDCVELNSGYSFRWNDQDCGNQNIFICRSNAALQG